MFHKILVAMDNSANAEQVFDQALALAKVNSARIMLLHVLSAEQGPKLPVFSTGAYSPAVSVKFWESYRSQWEAFEQLGLELLRQAKEKVSSAGVDAKLAQLSGSPGRTICDSAREWGADLIVIGRRGHSGLSELFLGSVSNYVLHHAPCCVLTVQYPVKTSTHAATNPEQHTEFGELR